MNQSLFLRLLCAVTLSLGLTSTVAAATYSGAFSQSVPEANAAGITSTIAVAGDEVISSLTVSVNIDHPWIGDLFILLTAPNGTSIVLLDRPGIATPGAGLGACCGSGADLDSITFDDAAVLAAEDIVSSTDLNPVASPTDALAQLGGLSVAGDWTLTIADFAQGQMNTNVPQWTLVVNESVQPVPLPGALGLLFAGVCGLGVFRPRS